VLYSKVKNAGCILAGIDTEGLYRVSGFHSDIEAIKLSFDKGATDFLTVKHINSY